MSSLFFIIICISAQYLFVIIICISPQFDFYQCAIGYGDLYEGGICEEGDGEHDAPVLDRLLACSSLAGIRPLFVAEINCKMSRSGCVSS